MIPAEAVEAALLAIQQPDHWLMLNDEAKVRDILEAAAPHMLAPLLSLLDEAESRGGSSMYCKVTTYEARKALGQDVSDWQPSEPWPSGLRARLAAWAKESGRTTHE